MIKDYLELEGQSKADAAASAKDWKQAIIEIAKRRAAKNENKDGQRVLIPNP